MARRTTIESYEGEENETNCYIDRCRLRHIRCENCKVALHDELVTSCPVCGAVFDSIMSNHAGLAARFEQRREDAGVRHCNVPLADTDEDAVELVSA